jgi:hypothetical protein
MTANTEVSAEELLKQFFDVVLEEVRTNKQFALRLVGSLPSHAVARIETSRKRVSKPPEPPVSLTRLMNREGEEALRDFLKRRNKPQLKLIVERQQIPIQENAFGGKADALRDAIVEGVRFKIADRLAAAS